MTEFRIRLRSVRPKNGGAGVRVLHNEHPNYSEDVAENWRGTMIEQARFIAESGEGVDIDGFLVIALWADGQRSVGFRMPDRIPRELFPAYIAEMLRTDAITEKEAERTIDRRVFGEAP